MLSNDLIGAAGVHFAAYRLSLRGLVVLPTIRNTAGADMLVWNPKTGGHAAVQVKTSGKRVTFWPTSRPEKSLGGTENVFIFLRFDPELDGFEGFLVQADRVVQDIGANLADHRDRGRKEFPYWGLPADPQAVQALARAWETWAP